MSRYIDADALLKAVERYFTGALTASEREKILADAPSIDIVRCKECIHCADDWNGNQPMFTCELGRCGESVQPNDFCSYGERREP